MAIFGNDNSVDWTYANGRKARAIVVPQVKDKESFMKQSVRLQWVESMLDHLVGKGQKNDKEDAAEWMITYLGKRYDTAFTLASEALRTPVVQRLDEASAEAMWSDANINVVQQRIIRKHLKYHFGSRLFIPQKIFKENREYYNVPTNYNCFKYYKDGDKLQKPEKCPYWTCDPSAVVSKEVTKLLDYTEQNFRASRLSSIANTTCTIVAGADQGQGAWRSWIKISTESGQQIREKMAADSDYDAKTSYIVSQVAHITCKKDHHEILAATVSENLSSGYEKLQSSCLVFIQSPSTKARRKAVFISKHAFDIRLEEDAQSNQKMHLTYFLLGGGEKVSV